MLPRTPEELRGRRAARWIRESTAGQYDRYGPAAQRELQARAIARLGLVDVGLEWSPAHSGGTVYASPAMRAMLDAARGGGFDVLLVAYVARWQRNLRRTLELLEDELHPAGVAVWFCDEELLSSSERAWDQLVDEAKGAESWLRKHRRRVREGCAAKLEQRRDPGGHPPFGFRRNAAKLVEPDSERVPIVQRAYELCAAGSSDRDAAAELGLPLFTLRGILTSPLVAGRLRDGGPANWPPIVPRSLIAAAQAQRARRSTNTGRPADPRRPYALSMLHCAACGARLTGDTGYYRHRDPCARFLAARPPRRRGVGSGYRREWYEDVVEELLASVRLDDATIAAVVRELLAPAPTSRFELARIDRERDAALARYRRDRDPGSLTVAMERLDREEIEARQVGAPPPPAMDASDVVAYLRDLPRLWQATVSARRAIAEALFERIDVLGFRRATVRLTDDVVARGLAAGLPDSISLAGKCRGERI